ncbi:vitamin B12-dependent ribonucleotide reductase [Candidatus Woesearchaeota archaeon]|nr:vitamin B12-dependent ribonucleotide reductase [Candidatus Woesearchaeota archaeon]
MGTLKQIQKRDGSIVNFDQIKIAEAIFKAAKSVGGHDFEKAKYVASLVSQGLENKFNGHTIPKVEQIQDLVENVLIEGGYASTAKAYILYRENRKKLRDEKLKILGREDDLKLPMNSIKVLAERYLKRNHDGKLVETPKDMFRRVAENIASADALYNGNVEETSKKFFDIMTSLIFLPNSPTLMNAGNELQQLAGCFVLPVGDSISEIFDGVKHAAIIHKSGGGTGFAFSRLRPKNDVVMSTKGVSSGPISFMKVYNVATETIKQGGKRRGANMGILRIDHPDIIEFINCKEKEGAFNNFNISVGLTEKFMQAVENDEEYELYNPRTKIHEGSLLARDVFNLIVTNAWKNGEPGIVFLDRMNRDNPTPEIGEIESTNPCGEQPLLPYESCNLGSINLVKFVKNGNIDYDELRKVVHISVHFLDNVIDKNNFPLPEIENMTKGNRKIGLGIMGFADMLLQLNIGYNTEQAVETAEKIMGFIQQESKLKSIALAVERGNFPNIERSIYNGQNMRNATRTTIAPTGSIGMIADASNGIEPLFAISFVKQNILGGDHKLLYINHFFEKIAKERGFYSEELMEEIAKTGSVQHVDAVPQDVKKIFVVSHDIDPIWHIKIQAAFQRNIENAVSKTVNFTHDATTKDVEKAFLLAYQLGCKGITIYRDGSREAQVINLDTTKHHKKKETEENLCPQCKTKLYHSEGCSTCPSCGFSKCSV